MLWIVAFFVTIAVVMVGIRRWKMANNEMYAIDESNRKAWEKESGEELVYGHDKKPWYMDPVYTGLSGNIYTDDDD